MQKQPSYRPLATLGNIMHATPIHSVMHMITRCRDIFIRIIMLGLLIVSLLMGYSYGQFESVRPASVSTQRSVLIDSSNPHSFEPAHHNPDTHMPKPLYDKRAHAALWRVGHDKPSAPIVETQLHKLKRAADLTSDRVQTNDARVQKLIGNWRAINETQELMFRFNPHGQCQWMLVQYEFQQRHGDCRWALHERGGKRLLKLHFSAADRIEFHYDVVSNTEFHITGIQNKHSVWRFSAIQSVLPSAQVAGYWFIGIWDHNIDLNYDQSIKFSANGELSVVTRRSRDNHVLSVRRGEWRVDALRMYYSIDEAPTYDGEIRVLTPGSGEYELASLSRNRFELSGSTQDAIFVSYNRRYSYLSLSNY